MPETNNVVDTNKNQLDSMLDKIKSKTQEAQTPKANSNEVATKELELAEEKLMREPKAPSVPEKIYQRYVSSQKSMRMITYSGAPVIFVNGELITDNTAVIAYLDKEIKNGLRAVNKAGEVNSNDADPMARLRQELKKEMEAEVIADFLRKERERQVRDDTTGIMGTNALANAESSNSSVE
jgi:hypothetical protein